MVKENANASSPNDKFNSWLYIINYFRYYISKMYYSQKDQIKHQSLKLLFRRTNSTQKVALEFRFHFTHQLRAC